jgi:uncharacterized NAD-dependent epimerase/dehydratase family protein
MAHGQFGIWTSKTATCVLRYSKTYEAVAVLDRTKAPGIASDHVGDIGRGVPIMASLQEALRLKPEALLIGIAPMGGVLPQEWRDEIQLALTQGLDVISGLHTFLADDPELARLAKESGSRIWDVRRPTKPERIATGAGLNVRAPVVHTMGTDCNSGKMTTSVEIVREAQRRGIDAAFAATGQTGIMIGCDAGAPIDRIVSDFVAGAAEELVLECDAKGKALIVVEGQGATTHPSYSGVTVGLMHGCFPDLIVLCHQAGRNAKGAYAPGDHRFPTLSLREEIDLIERLLKPVSGGRVVAVALQTPGLSESAAQEAIRQCAQETGLPTTDPVRYGAGVLLDAVIEASQTLKKPGVNRLRPSVLSKPT